MVSKIKLKNKAPHLRGRFKPNQQSSLNGGNFIEDHLMHTDILFADDPDKHR